VSPLILFRRKVRADSRRLLRINLAAPFSLLKAACPVEIEYAAQPGYTDKRPVWEQAAEAFGHYVGSGGEGDVLVFHAGRV